MVPIQRRLVKIDVFHRGKAGDHGNGIQSKHHQRLLSRVAGPGNAPRPARTARRKAAFPRRSTVGSGVRCGTIPAENAQPLTGLRLSPANRIPELCRQDDQPGRQNEGGCQRRHRRELETSGQYDRQNDPRKHGEDVVPAPASQRDGCERRVEAVEASTDLPVLRRTPTSYRRLETYLIRRRTQLATPNASASKPIVEPASGTLV